MAHSITAEHHDDHAGDHGHGDHPKWLAHHFDTPVQQYDTAKLGMWAFLIQELLFFSGLFVAYGVYRSWYPEMFKAASHQLDKIMGGNFLRGAVPRFRVAPTLAGLLLEHLPGIGKRLLRCLSGQLRDPTYCLFRRLDRRIKNDLGGPR